jgi:voltage-gated potassium channel Kch
LNAIVTVVELRPSAELVGRAREHEITLLTGNATLDETLNLSNMPEARCAVVVTDNDATNLEIGLGARARQAGIPVIMRVTEARFAAAIRAQFEIRRAFSATALASPLFSDLAESGAARGRVGFGERTYRLEEHQAGSTDRSATPLAAVGEGGRIRAVRDWSAITPIDTVLTIKPGHASAPTA